MTTKDYYKSVIILSFSLIIFEGIVFYFGVNRPYWGDEAHFVDTINRFGKDLSLNTIKHYNEMSTPLPFLLYSIWGRIFSFNIQVLRIFSVVIAFFTYLLFHKLIFSIFNDIKISLLTTAYIVIHPYMVGLSIFVFTDMLAVLFVITSCISIREQNPFTLSISLGCGLLCRQYLLFFMLAVGLYYLGEYYKARSNDTRKMLLSCFIALMPLIFLGMLWKGLSPDNELKNIYLEEGYGFHLSYFSLYVCLLFIYLVPIILISWKLLYTNNKILILSLISSSFYWIFPVRACKYQINEKIYTVGFFHKFVKTISKNQFTEDVIFYMAFLLGVPIIIFIVKDIYFRWQKRCLGFSFLLDLSVTIFLVVMPFSYLCWEKYFLPVLPLATTRILMAKYEK